MPNAEAIQPTILDQVKESVKEFEATQTKYRDFGAADSEPDGVWQRLLDRAIKGEAPSPPRTGDGWDLYVSSMGCAEAAQALFTAALKTIQLIESCPVRDLARLQEFIEKHCWRIY